MLNLTYDLWNALIEDVVDEHAPLFEAMHSAADKLKLNRDLVEELKIKGFKEVKEGLLTFALMIELHEDRIGGFRISLITAEDLDLLEEAKVKVAEMHGFEYADIENFEVEHGLVMNEEIFSAMEDAYSISVQPGDDSVIFELVIFDSKDIDGNLSPVGDVWPSDTDSMN